MKITSHQVLSVCITVISALAGVFLCGNAECGIVPSASVITPLTTPAGDAVIRVGTHFASKEWRNFDTYNMERTQYSLPGISVYCGMSKNTELIFDYEFLMLKRGSESFKAGTGDLEVKALFDLVAEKEMVPDIGLLISTKLPNGNYADGFGTDETDIAIMAAMLKKFGFMDLVANLGLGILGRPDGNVPDQDDVFIYEIAGVFPVSDSFRLGCEVCGVANSRFSNDRSRARVSLAFDTEVGTFDAGIGRGMMKESGEFHFFGGWTTSFQMPKY